MSKNCAFTICAKNYIGLASALQESIYNYYTDLDFYIIVADELDGDENLSSNVFVAKDVLSTLNEKWEELSFKYNITEFCTAIKPSSFLFLAEKGYERICYIDPDILFFNSIQPIFDDLQSYCIYVTPHICKLDSSYNRNFYEDEIRITGMFNFGFVGIKICEKTIYFLKWWGTQLSTKCYVDDICGMFTDQKMGDYLPVYFNSDELFISKNIGMNIAPWNSPEREIHRDNNYLFVSYRGENKKYPIIFVHYSGFDYKGLFTNTINQNNAGHETFNDFNLLIDEYIKFLKKRENSILNYLNKKYTYNCYSNGDYINPIHRRIARVLVDYEHKNINLFDSKGWFYNQLKKKKLLSRQNLDKTISPLGDNNYSKKLRYFYFLFRFVYKILGYKHYLAVLKLFKAFSHYENQLYLLDSKWVKLWYKDYLVK